MERFLAAMLNGEVSELERMLADDVVAWSDGGGKVAATRHPVFGHVEVARLLTRLAATARAATAEFSIATVNGGPAVLMSEAGAVTVILVPEFGDDRIVAVHSILTPDKLAFTSAAADTSALCWFSASCSTIHSIFAESLSSDAGVCWGSWQPGTTSNRMG